MSLPMEKATYLANAFAISFGEADNENGTKQVGVTFEIVNDDGGDGGPAPTGETISWIGFFTDKTAARTIESLCHCGWQGDDFAEFEGLSEAEIRAKLPETVELACEPEEYEGNFRLRVRWVNRRGGGRLSFKKPIAGSDLKAFGAQMRATVKSVRGAGGAPRTRAAAPASGGSGRQGGGSGRREDFGGYGHPNAPGSSDDIPF